MTSSYPSSPSFLWLQADGHTTHTFHSISGCNPIRGGFFRPPMKDHFHLSLPSRIQQLTGALSHVLPIMVSVMTSKWVGDALGKDGIYPVWIAMRRYPWLPPVHYRDKGETAAHVMRSVSNLVVVTDGVTTVKDLLKILRKHDYHGFPVIDKHGEYVGYSTRDELQLAIGIFAVSFLCFGGAN